MIARKLTVGQHAGFPTYKAESKQAPTGKSFPPAAGFSSRRPFVWPARRGQSPKIPSLCVHSAQLLSHAEFHVDRGLVLR